ncbi:hypothetical protein OEZ86_005709 [Tetradesmus obliquus]|nr:hypothetical protein OEZ86_005709 [Tetradesmus obliquus]
MCTLAADGLDGLTELVQEGSQALKASWQDTAAAAGRLYEQLDKSLADKDQHLATTAGQALGQLTQTLLNTPQRDGSKLQAALTPSVTALSGAAQQAVSKWGDALRQHLRKQISPPAPAPSAAAPATPSVVSLDGQPVQGEAVCS